jgi:hypothetical protein
MATSTGTPLGSRNSGTDTNYSRDQRLSTETKAAPKTTEFMAYLAVLAGILISGLIIEDKGGNDFFAADKVWLYATILTSAYLISRGLAKSGSREPFWAGGTNANRDLDGRNN